MEKLSLGTIGTSWITDSFIQAALESDAYTLSEVYSRSEKKGNEFAKKYGDISVEDDLDAFFNNALLDVIYIASPNSLHFGQAMQALKAKKHVIVEKPAVTSPKEWDSLINEAKKQGVFIFEAARHVHIPNFKKIKDVVGDLGDIKGASLAYAKYSSKFDAYLAGKEPNIFSLKFAGGALMDLGVYPIYLSVALFGMPEKNLYFSRKLKTGVDGNGTIILRYKEFDVTIFIGKNVTTQIGVEIYGENDTLLVDHATNMSRAELLNYQSNDKKEITLNLPKENDMIYEAKAFAYYIMNKEEASVKEEVNYYSNLAGNVAQIMYELRVQEDIHFPADSN